jgi:uncharacterized protein YyaL (SSP411 family)
MLSGCSSCSRGSADLPDAAPPAAPSTSPELRTKLREAARAKGPSYAARTRHKEADGSPKHTNRLILESSPYLLQHAHNPVEWFPWGDEAFETARRLGRPVLLSVGYSTCHWCHVMEEESFEDEEIAGYLNAHYVAIKVDREERPDVDAIYMSAVQSMTGSGGWPMTVWLTPDRRPFYGGTYFPPRDGERGTRTGFRSILQKLVTKYEEDPKSIAQSAAEMTKAVQEASAGRAPEPGSSAPATTALDSAAAQYRSRFDAVNGGMRGAPKFPSSLPVRFLLRDHRRNPTGDSLTMAITTLEHMARGGIHDHVGGGFHRYSTDDKWLVPHFEKMLYDNALLARAYLEAYQLTRREDFAEIARDIFAYVERELTSPEGAFYSASDADSLTPAGKREEGWFFTWTPAEIESVLGVQNARIFASYYAVTPAGNFEGRNILSTPAATADTAKKLDGARDTLRRERAKRPAPARDEKILTAWNGLMISAYAKSSLVLADAKHGERAERAADFVLRGLQRDGRLLRSYKDGQAKTAAYLDDYAFLIAALLDLHEATGRLRWLEEAIRLDQVLERHYEDKSAGGFFLTGDDQEKLLARDKPSYDGAEPSGNSVALLNLLRLHELTTKDGYRERAERSVQRLGPTLAAAPTSMSETLLALDYLADVPKQIVIVTPAGRTEAEPFLAKLREIFLPNAALVVVPEGEPLISTEKIVPLVASKIAKGGKATAYVCERRTCELPTADPDVFARLLRKTR